jgi:hypothetical protein
MLLNFLTLQFLASSALHLSNVYADSLNIKRCFCVSATELGRVSSYNWTNTAEQDSYVWNDNFIGTRNDTVCPIMQGIHCKSPHPDTNDCLTIPDLTCYPSVIKKVKPTGCSMDSCADVDGRHICANERQITVDGKETLCLHWYGRNLREAKGVKVMDCTSVCEAMWPEKGLRNACAHRNTNEKSKHYGQDVFNGYAWKGWKLWEIPGWSATHVCMEWNIKGFKAGR